MRVAAVFLGLVLSTPTAAQDHFVSVTGYVGSAGYSSLTDSTAPGVFLAPGGFNGVHGEVWFGRWGVRLHAGGARTAVDGSPGTEFGLLAADIDALYRFRWPRPGLFFQPYGVLGLGAIRYDLGPDTGRVGGYAYASDPTTRSTLVLGIGADFGSGPAALRLELTDIIGTESPLSRPDTGTFGAVSHVVLTLGLSVRAGEIALPPAPERPRPPARRPPARRPVIRPADTAASDTTSADTVPDRRTPVDTIDTRLPPPDTVRRPPPPQPVDTTTADTARPPQGPPPRPPDTTKQTPVPPADTTRRQPFPRTDTVRTPLPPPDTTRRPLPPPDTAGKPLPPPTDTARPPVDTTRVDTPRPRPVGPPPSDTLREGGRPGERPPPDTTRPRPPRPRPPPMDTTMTVETGPPSDTTETQPPDTAETGPPPPPDTTDTETPADTTATEEAEEGEETEAQGGTRGRLFTVRVAWDPDDEDQAAAMAELLDALEEADVPVWPEEPVDRRGSAHQRVAALRNAADARTLGNHIEAEYGLDWEWVHLPRDEDVSGEAVEASTDFVDGLSQGPGQGGRGGPPGSGGPPGAGGPPEG